VVVLDTEIGPHWWFSGDPPVSSFSLSDGSIVGNEIHPYPRETPRSAVGATDPLLGTLASRVGHGTFIAGLLRQACPEAAIVALPVMGADGVVPEHMLIRALDLILVKQRQSPGWADAVVLSLGYYAESTADMEYTSGLQRVLLQLGRVGVAVFASAGNDCTSRPSFPAALAVDPAFDGPDVMPVVSVAALNPDLSLAPFSNDGPWVSTAAIGVNVVSTAVTLDGGTTPAQETTDGRGRIHASVDPDSFRGGFATWSGTSFATPVVAGEYLSRLIDAGFPDLIADRLALLPLRRSGSRRWPGAESTTVR
jgi:subtilisin family serine protease